MSTNKPSAPNQTVKLSDEDHVGEILKSSIGNLWSAVNELTRLRPTKRERFSVSIFGSARIQPDDIIYREVNRLARDLAKMECSIITGGGPGLMQAANEGASEVEGCTVDCSVGIRVELPFEQDSNPYVQAEYEHKTFFTRLHHFVIASDAFVVVPGGIGTVLEAMTIWQLLQVGHLKGTPLIFLGEMWQELVAWAREQMIDERYQLASAEDIDIPYCVNTSSEAIAIINEAKTAWDKLPEKPRS